MLLLSDWRALGACQLYGLLRIAFCDVGLKRLCPGTLTAFHLDWDYITLGVGRDKFNFGTGIPPRKGRLKPLRSKLLLDKVFRDKALVFVALQLDLSITDTEHMVKQPHIEQEQLQDIFLSVGSQWALGCSINGVVFQNQPTLVQPGYCTFQFAIEIGRAHV